MERERESKREREREREKATEGERKLEKMRERERERVRERQRQVYTLQGKCMTLIAARTTNQRRLHMGNLCVYASWDRTLVWRQVTETGGVDWAGKKRTWLRVKGEKLDWHICHL